MALSPGSRIGCYEVLAKIGEGGMGEVWRAHDTQLGRDVALKTLPRDLSADSDRLARFRREARLLATLNHPGIAAIYGIEQVSETPALVLELVEGQTLADQIEQGPVAVPDAVALASQIAEALAAAHEHGIIHRDLKPANIKITPKGRVKVLDFGLAKAMATELPTVDIGQTHTASMTGTRDGVILGTAPYMSPEQARGQLQDERTDIWAFGCVLYEMLTAVSPFAGPTVSDTVVRVLDREPDWSHLPDDTPASLVTLIQRCLRKDVSQRYQQIDEVQRELKTPAGAEAPPARSARRTRPPTSRPLRWGVASIGVLAVAAGALVFGPDGTRAPIQSVAVLPFENASADPDGEYLSDGITENLIYRLSMVPDLRVVPRGISYAYGGGATDLRAIGAELEVQAIVTGRVAERDGTLVVRAELTDVTEVAQLWGEQYNRAMTDLLAVEEELVRQISAELRLQLSPEAEQRLTESATENPEAYQLFLKSRHHNLSLSPEGLDLGLEYARQAVELDPNYALGYAALSDAYVTRTFMGIEPVVEGYARARAAAERAVELDDTRAYPRLMMGFIKHHAEWDWEGALTEFRRALELEPENPDAHQSYSEALVSVGRLDDALTHAERAAELDPLFPNTLNWLAGVQRFLGHDEEALTTNTSVLELDPRHQLARANRPFLLARAGHVDDALAELAAQLETTGADPDTHPRLAALYAQIGRLDAAREMLDDLTLESVHPFDLTLVSAALAQLGDLDQAFEALDHAYEAHSPGLLFLPYRFPRDIFGGDPRYDAFLERMNFTFATRSQP